MHHDDADKRLRPAPDLVERKFTADGPNQLWVADMTLYLEVVGSSSRH